MAQFSVNVSWRKFAEYKGIEIHELLLNGKPGQNVYAIALGSVVVPSESLDFLRREVDAWWKLRRN